MPCDTSSMIEGEGMTFAGRSAPLGDSEPGCSAAKAVRGAAKRAMANIIASAMANESVARANAREVTGGPFPVA